MDRNRFDAEVCPALTEIPIGQRGIAFDRHELDGWADSMPGKRRSTRSGQTPFDAAVNACGQMLHAST